MKEQNIFDNSNVTASSSQLAILKQNFPSCFDKNGNFIIDSFKEIVKDNSLDFSQESYSLNWLGKSYAQLLRNEKPYTFIKPDHEHNNKKENVNSQNLLIKGDNLEVLKHLRNAYTEKIKMIYIDPPYNTGFDGFIYQDDRKFTKEELMQLAKVSEYEAQRILDFTSKGSNSHSAWLTFIYPRLYIARELLREDGVIFISIDDNEQAQLKLLCDEIFGEENYISVLPTIMNLKGNNAEFGFAGTHEYTLVYSRNLAEVKISEYPLEDHLLEEWLEDDISFYKKGAGLKATGQEDKREDRPKMFYPIFFKNNTLILPTEQEFESLTNKEDNSFNDENLYSLIQEYEKKGYKTILPYSGQEYGRWRWGFSLKNKKLYQTDTILNYDKKNNSYSIYKKQRPSIGDLPTRKPKSIFYKPEYSSGAGTSIIQQLFDNVKIFNNPKPLALITDIIYLTTNNNSNDIVLDFFAGSGTTAHAVIDLNAEDNGNRQFILVQLPEETDKKSEAYKAGYNTIFDITKARIEKVAEKIKQDNPEYEGDLGFKIFETMSLPNHYDNEIVELSIDSQIEMFEGAKDNPQLLEAILTTWTLYDRIPLTDSLKNLLIDKYEAQYSNQHNTLYLMKPNFTTENIKTLIEKIEVDDGFIPEKIVIYGFNFHSKIQRELDEALRSYQNKKSLNIDLIVRYY
ncbi:site-specific DNA-methyltransferase [Ignatzschineria indica]|uniref:site-specific DNA-methyltransferase n=1 Tax=Ignatzschineria indica TaxID=472583 RepID=UPI002578DAFF|nr:site-specific DNA-methyltransferase [Ignatzschineria indica]MDM1545382.1 site-specific DNA-methyltransferase [Ignatzschineria indica]